MSPLLLALLAQLQADFGARIDASGGVVPTGVVEVESRSAVDLVIAPSVGLRYQSRRTRLTLGYSPRLLVRTFLEASSTRDAPLLLHQLDLALSLDARRDTRVELAASASAGELDYVGAGALFADTPGTLPPAEIIEFRAASATARARHALTRADALLAELSLGLSAPVGDGEQLFPEQRSLGGALGYERRFTSSDRGVLRLWVEDTRFSQRLMTMELAQAYLRVQPELAWLHATERLESELALGLAAVVGEETTLVPAARASIGAPIFRRRAIRLGASLAVGHEATPNVVLATVDPRAFARLRVRIELPPRWSIEPELGAYLLTTFDPRPAAVTGAARLGDTLLTAALPARYTIDERTSLELGARFGVRGPHLGDADFALGQVELIGYAALRVGGSARLDGR